jgi:hypothetical protein
VGPRIAYYRAQSFCAFVSLTHVGAPDLRLTDKGQQTINELAQRYSVSTDAVMSLLQALVNGNGTMAQFNHQELGGGGQWMLMA